MAGIKHAKTSAVSDSADTSLVQPSNWNADHSITGAVDFGSYTHLADVINESTTDAGVTIESVALEDGAIVATSLNLGDEDLDTYDEGTWTPVLTFGTPGDLSVAYTTQTGTYTRIGQLVTCGFYVITSSFTHTTAAGAFRITGLPFTVAATNDHWAGVMAADGWTLSITSGWLTLKARPGQTDMEVHYSRSAAGTSGSTTSHWPTGGQVEIRGTVTYETSA